MCKLFIVFVHITYEYTVGGYHKEKGLVLIMDVARFKYPPFWVPLNTLWDSMCTVDGATGSPRGYFVVSAVDSCTDTIPVITAHLDALQHAHNHPNISQTHACVHADECPSFVSTTTPIP